MKFEDIKNLVEGKTVKVLNNTGAIQVDLETGQFLALIYIGKDWNENDDYFALDLHDTTEEALEDIKGFKLEIEV